MKHKPRTELNFNNRYFILRHGRSLANEEGIIVSNMQDGVEGWGLVRESAANIRDSLNRYDLSSDTVIFTSPFKRAYETALVAAQVLNCGAPIIAAPLRERFFGSLDKKADSYYPDVWADDALNSGNTKSGVESPAEVLSRLTDFIIETDSNFSDRTILMVSHGDPLNILLTYAAGSPLINHMKIDPMKTAELRNLFP